VRTDGAWKYSGSRAGPLSGLRLVARRRKEPPQVVVEEVGDPADRDIGRGKGGDHLRVEGEAALSRKDPRHAIAPAALDGGEDAQLVVDERIARGRIPALDIVQGVLLVDIDEHVSADRLGYASVLDLAWLEDDIPVGENDGRPHLAKMPQHIEGA